LIRSHSRSRPPNERKTEADRRSTMRRLPVGCPGQPGRWSRCSRAAPGSGVRRRRPGCRQGWSSDRRRHHRSRARNSPSPPTPALRLSQRT
jgi:hypothetical protein